ncbi:LysR family transcriptional regulator [Shewanella gelidii]|uniref:LysR family transcriptional regulator n=1 Tax=Shewanella gelidii TaxID=1642821 RepID=A0A917NEE3_9GAMM|nr:LysR family transcriptional regulator [Shewanella gelidii]MCL1099594.1 LysR family transcriptional regulator [Shewanella gelidii]GGI92615.1 LysR family transcriptional regulator [Shewanella gelidii]
MLSKSLRVISELDIFSLIVFKVLYEKGAANNTASELEVSAPKVSRCLASLRTAFDDELFYRRQQGLKPTPLAEALYKPICDFYRIVSHLDQVALGEPESTFAPTINIAVSKYIMTSLALALNQHPQQEVLGKIRLQQWGRSSEELISDGQIDFGITLESSEAAGLNCEHLGAPNSLYLAAKQEHPIWEYSPQITLEQIAMYPFAYLESIGFNDRIDPLELYCRNARVELADVDKVMSKEELLSHLLTMGSLAFISAVDVDMYSNIPALRTEALDHEQHHKLHIGQSAPQYYLIEKRLKNRRYNEERRSIVIDIVTDILKST